MEKDVIIDLITGLNCSFNSCIDLNSSEEGRKKGVFLDHYENGFVYLLDDNKTFYTVELHPTLRKKLMRVSSIVREGILSQLARDLLSVDEESLKKGAAIPLLGLTDVVNFRKNHLEELLDEITEAAA